MSKIEMGIKSLVAGNAINQEETQDIMRKIMSGDVNDIQIASFLTALRIRGETPDNITGAAKIMREFANGIHPKETKHMVDVVGTGGDNANTFNISSLAAIVAASAGVTVAKHGNRSVSSKCGAADILEALGVKIDLEPSKVEECINSAGIGFMFAPKFHPAMKYAMPVRRMLKMRTIFNILGPLTNPASAESYVLGVYDKELIKPISEVMKNLGAKHIYVVNSEPGIDEIIPISEVHFGEVIGQEIKYYSLKPSDFGVEAIKLEDIQGGTLDKNLEIAVNILKNKETGAKKQVVLINAAFAILASGLSTDYKEAYKKAEDTIESGKVLKTLKKFVKNSGGDLATFEKLFS